jgi:hypothetical protein
MLLNPDSGEVLGQASVAFMELEEVDSTKFVKMFLAGIRKTVGLSKAGLTVFEWVFDQVRSTPGSDRIMLTAFEAGERGIAERTFNRGLRELLDKEFLFASPARGLYWLNISYLFNGDRLHFVTTYHLKGGGERLGQGRRKSLAAPDGDQS